MISLKDVSFRYSEEKGFVLRNVSLEIKKGAFILIAGRSGCGKTTLMRCINGVIPHFINGDRTGDVLLGGREVGYMEVYDIAEQIGSVFQDPRCQFFTINVTDEVAFGLENLGYERKIIIEKVDEAFSRFKIENLRNREMFGLSSGEKQKVIFASIYAMSPDVYVLDEPSANLDNLSVWELKDILSSLKEEGKTIIIAEHRLFYLADLYDRVLVMDNGRIIEENTDHDELSRTRKNDLGLRAFDLNELDAENQNARKKEMISIQNLTFRYRSIKKNVLQGLMTGFCKGDRVAIVGYNGAGKTTFAKLLAGLLKEYSGSIAFDSVPLKPRERLRRTGFVMQETGYQLFSQSVIEEMKLGLKPTGDRITLINETLNRLELLEFKDQHPQTLSGGQKQRLTVGAAIVKEPEVLILDEPTSGLDARHMTRMAELLNELSLNGTVILVVTHDYEFITRSCNLVIFIGQGKVLENCSVNNLSQNLRGFFRLH